jgi:hypothetical protein
MMATILTQSADRSEALLPGERWDRAVFSTILDDRGRAAVNWAKDRVGALTELRYDAESTDLFTASEKLSSAQLRSWFSPLNSVLLETTTMGVVELLLSLKAAYQQGVKTVDLLYVEPVEYQRSDPIKWGREFSLSDSRKLAGVKGFSCEIGVQDHGQVVAFLGYESARLRQALEQLPLHEWSCHAVFGVPGYEPGWEINALANNIGVLDGRNWEIKFCAAASVSAAYRLLASLTKSQHFGDRPTLVLPLGTKPHSIACCIFLVEHSEFQLARTTYDHPERSSKRSQDVRRWHCYRVRFD